MTSKPDHYANRPIIATVLVAIGATVSLIAALGAWSTFANYLATSQTHDVPFILLPLSLLPSLVLLGTAVVTYWVYKLKEDAIWLSLAMATSPAWTFIVANLDPSRRFVDHAKLSDIGALWAWSFGFLFVAGYMHYLKSNGRLSP